MFFSVRGPNTKMRPKANGLSRHRILLLKDKSPVSEGEEHRMKKMMMKLMNVTDHN